MRIEFYTEDGHVGDRDWPAPPREGEGVRLYRIDYKVVETNWGDHISGVDEPIVDKPTVSVLITPDPDDGISNMEKSMFTAGITVESLINKLQQHDPEAIVEVDMNVKKGVGSISNKYNVISTSDGGSSKATSFSFVTLHLHGNNLINEAERAEK